MVRANSFAWRGQWFTGLFCERCNNLRDNPDDSFLAAVAKTSQERPDAAIIVGSSEVLARLAMVARELRVIAARVDGDENFDDAERLRELATCLDPS